jgi:hypothetical protein
MLNSLEVNILGQILNDTWGEWSTKISPTMSVKAALSGDILECKYITIATLPSGYHDKASIEMNEQQSTQVTNSFMKSLRARFKKEAGRPIKVKQLGTNDSLEMITQSTYSSKRNAYYRRTTTYRVE